MIVISKRSPNTLAWANSAIERAPNLALHARQMQWFQSLGALDFDTARAACRTGPQSWDWIATWPLSVAAAINALHPEVFNDRTGKTMQRFLETDEGAWFRIKRR